MRCAVFTPQAPNDGNVDNTEQQADAHVIALARSKHIEQKQNPRQQDQIIAGETPRLTGVETKDQSAPGHINDVF
ncbi:hypothetical protein D3C85_1736580 [compost metagenome]